MECVGKMEDVMRKLILSHIGNDSFDRPVYKNGNNLFVDVDPRKDRKPEICTKMNNCFNGEPDIPIQYLKGYEDVEIEFLPKRITWY